jgi:HlyD family secretion protein
MDDQSPQPTKLKFRDAALEQIATGEKLDHFVQVTTRKSWIVLSTFSVIIIAALIWGIWGSIPTSVEGTGILLAEKGNIFTAVAPEGSAHIVAIEVKPEDFVKKGDVLARLENPDLTEQIKAMKDYLEKLRKKFSDLTNESKKEIEQMKQETDEQNHITKRMIKIETANLNYIKTMIKKKNLYARKGYVASNEIIVLKKDYYVAKKEVEKFNNQLIQNEIAKTNFIEQWDQRLRELELKIIEQQHQYAILKEKSKIAHEVCSTVTGTVINIQKNPGDIVNTGEVILNLASEGTGPGLDAVIYVLPEEGKRIQPGMPALVSPTIIKKEEFGSIEGKVLTVSDFPSNPHSMLKILQNEELVKKFANHSAPIEVRIQLHKDPKTFSGLEWSSSNGPPQKISPGTLARGRVTVREQAPVSLLIPAFKKLIEG